jgi:CRP/FNR family transcriptional regulator, anaerobic regulatory protein
MTDKTQQIISFVSSVLSLTAEELTLLLGALQIKTLSKNDFFLKEGQVCDSIAFVNAGVLIYVKSTDKGEEVTTDFAFENEWVTNNQSRLSGLPSLISIKAIEDAELLVLSHNDLTALYRRIPKLEKLGRMLMEQAFVKIAQVSIDLQVLSATERYEKLLQKYPAVFQKIPLYHIAHYLGLAPKSLSRIRNDRARLG